MSTRQPSLLRKAISVLASFALAVAFVPTAWANASEGTAQVQIMVVNSQNGSTQYKVGDAQTWTDLTGDQPTTVNVPVGGTIVIHAVPNGGQSLDANATKYTFGGSETDIDLNSLTGSSGWVLTCQAGNYYVSIGYLAGAQTSDDNVFLSVEGIRGNSAVEYQIDSGGYQNAPQAFKAAANSVVTFKVTPTSPAELIENEPLAIYVHGPDRPKLKNAQYAVSDGTHSISFTVKENTEYDFECKFKGSTGSGNVSGGEGASRPENFGDASYLSFDIRAAEGSKAASGIISYFIGTTAPQTEEGWTSVGKTEGNADYVPVSLSGASEGDALYVKIKAAAGEQLDADGGVRFFSDNRQPVLSVWGTANNDSNYNADKDGAQIEQGNPSKKMGLRDFRDTANDCYIIPINNISSYANTPFYMEFAWIKAMDITVEVDAASQYMLTEGKVEIGISTGKGFYTSVQNGGSVSIPVLPYADLEQRTEFYNFGLKIKSEYRVPSFSLNNMKSIETVDTGEKEGDSLVISAGLSSQEFQEMMEKSGNKLTIHLTVDKVVSVSETQPAEGQSEASSSPAPPSNVSASFTMIDDGKGTSAEVQALDKKTVVLTATENSTNNFTTEGLPAYEINMSVDGTPSTDFARPIDITVNGDFTEGKEYVVYHEHNGQLASEPLDSDLSVYKDDKGNVVRTTLTFSTDKFSTFSIAEKPTSSGEGGGEGNNGGSGPVAPPYVPSTPAPAEPEKAPIANTGSGDSASATVDVTDKVTTTETGSTQVAVDADLGTKIVENAVANKVADVVIKAETTAGASTETAVALPASTVKELAEKTEASVTISTDSAQVTLDKAAVAAVAEQAGDAGSVQLVVQTSEQNKNKIQIEVTLQTSNGNVSDFRGGSVRISVPVTEELAAKKIVCVYIDANGKYTKMPGALSADGKSYVFSTGHFSTYAVMSEEEANAAIAEQEKAEAAALAAAKPAAPSVKLASLAKGKLTVKASAKKAKGYRVYYKKAGWKAYKTYTTSGTVKALSKTFKKLSKGTYTVKVRAFGKTAAGKIAWGAKSKAKKVAVK